MPNKKLLVIIFLIFQVHINFTSEPQGWDFWRMWQQVRTNLSNLYSRFVGDTNKKSSIVKQASSVISKQVFSLPTQEMLDKLSFKQWESKIADAIRIYYSIEHNNLHNTVAIQKAKDEAIATIKQQINFIINNRVYYPTDATKLTFLLAKNDLLMFSYDYKELIETACNQIIEEIKNKVNKTAVDEHISRFKRQCFTASSENQEDCLIRIKKALELKNNDEIIAINDEIIAINYLINQLEISIEIENVLPEDKKRIRNPWKFGIKKEDENVLISGEEFGPILRKHQEIMTPIREGLERIKNNKKREELAEEIIKYDKQIEAAVNQQIPNNQLRQLKNKRDKAQAQYNQLKKSLEQLLKDRPEKRVDQIRSEIDKINAELKSYEQKLTDNIKPSDIEGPLNPTTMMVIGAGLTPKSEEIKNMEKEKMRLLNRRTQLEKILERLSNRDKK